ncbi:uncharacterized protein Z520_12021 [Fonsecaea multimorphosa CBS 102226]|uniref:RING-type E3 ubiquitin transferase n=1 Tax=Fonsecaea multimorphosa CBS 102226 TaxID=1442371 RepID=A0A0D2GRX4_9EURO|nr:uncharacterized protein Z520_12021 [Fonsecaea multimorphosa CBS 102226]KIX92275.1 hypothetical protein Z520_12021 [Fonsecaea multimorphosa CBS 102226]OAL17647.1 hypothetical protein AYO22_11437 [Fonsecaea multimorphosa]
MATESSKDEIALNLSEPPSSKTALLPLSEDTLPPPEQCVICLDNISDKAIALPCHHDQFDFSCLGTWLQRQQVCPLCKGQVTAIRFNLGDPDEQRSQVFYLPPENSQASRSTHGLASAAARQRRSRQGRAYRRGGSYNNARGAHPEALKDTALEFRRQVYRQRLYSLHVGTNRISRYRSLTPSSLAADEQLISRARMWIRRELQVFSFLNPSAPQHSRPGATDRRASNADFLLEYIIGILKSIDLKGSAGQAEELLKDFLGRDNARLFLHELEAWLRSPYEHLKDWDRAVQYAMPSESEPCHDGSRAGRSNNISCRQTSGTKPPETGSGVPRWFSERFVLGDDGLRTTRT